MELAGAENEGGSRPGAYTCGMRIYVRTWFVIIRYHASITRMTRAKQLRWLQLRAAVG